MVAQCWRGPKRKCSGGSAHTPLDTTPLHLKGARSGREHDERKISAGKVLARGRALRESLLEHPSLPLIFLSQPVIGPGIFRGIEGLVGALQRAGLSSSAGLHAIYAVLIYTTGFVSWELPRTVRQTEAAYAAAWRREFATLPPEEFPVTATVVDELPRLAGHQQFELGLQALVVGLTTGAS